jgi:hypothetical protein
LKASLRERFARICPGLRLEIAEALDNREMSVGLKRRNLLADAKGKYTTFIDDDDDVTDAYFEDFLLCFTEGKDVMRIRGQMDAHTFTHSTANLLSGTLYVDGVFMRPPNHLNPMLADIAKLVTFVDATRGEDLKWTIDLAKMGLLRTETQSDPSRIHYIYNINGRHVPIEVIEYQKTHTYEEWSKVLLVPARKPEVKTGALRLTSRGFVSK